MAKACEKQTRIQEISSARNPLVKVFRRALAEGTTRDGWLAVEGGLLLREALKARVTVHSVLVERSGVEKFRELVNRLPHEAEVAEIPDRLFRQIAETESPQGIAALVELAPRNLDAVLRQADNVLLVACGIQDPGNLGTMIRSGWALGATALMATKETVSPDNPKTLRSTAGAIFHLPVFPNWEAETLFERLRAAGIRSVAADPRSPSTLADADLKGPVGFLIGREASGLPEEISRQATVRLRVPIRTGTDSVNAATAAGIFLYEAARQRGFKRLNH